VEFVLGAARLTSNPCRVDLGIIEIIKKKLTKHRIESDANLLWPHNTIILLKQFQNLLLTLVCIFLSFRCNFSSASSKSAQSFVQGRRPLLQRQGTVSCNMLHVSCNFFQFCCCSVDVVCGECVLFDMSNNYDNSFYMMGFCILVSGSMLYPIPCIQHLCPSRRTHKPLILLEPEHREQVALNPVVSDVDERP